jgi:hypothetical protein
MAGRAAPGLTVSIVLTRRRHLTTPPLFEPGGECCFTEPGGECCFTEPGGECCFTDPGG